MSGKTSYKKEFEEARNTSGVLTRTHIGGQALIEGIMMRGRYNWAVAVREPGGTIYTEEHDLRSGRKKNSWMCWPIIRGCTALVESLALGYQALSIATAHAYDFSEEGEEIASTDEKKVEPPVESRAEEAEGDDPDAKKKDAFGVMMTVSMVLGVVLGIVIFIVVPAVITNLIAGDYASGTFVWNLIDGILRVAIFIFYLWLIGRMKDIKRMFAYHGAEHKTIHCYEHGLALTPENAQQFPTLHVRCGTAFLVITLIIAIFVFTVIPINALLDLWNVQNGIARLALVIAARIVLLPIVAGLAYEVTVKWAGSHPDKRAVRIVLWPGMQMQRLTTSQPDTGMLECAIAAMELVLAREAREAKNSELSDTISTGNEASLHTGASPACGGY
jgi:uncharacterized protein YqhQ